MTQQPSTYQKQKQQPPSQEEIQVLDEQQLESVTGGGIVSAVKNLFKKTPKTNPYYDPNWTPSPSKAPVTLGLKPGDPTRVNPSNSKLGTISE